MINTAIQSTDKNAWLFSRYDVIHLQNVNKSSDVHFQTLLWQFVHFVTFLNIQMGLIIIKERPRAFYFNNPKTLHFKYVAALRCE